MKPLIFLKMVADFQYWRSTFKTLWHKMTEIKISPHQYFPYCSTDIWALSKVWIYGYLLTPVQFHMDGNLSISSAADLHVMPFCGWRVKWWSFRQNLIPLKMPKPLANRRDVSAVETLKTQIFVWRSNADKIMNFWYEVSIVR